MTPAEYERQLAREIGLCQHDPLRHARFCYPWGRPGGPLEKHAGPRKWQAEALTHIGNHLRNPATRYTPLMMAIASGHGIGKSAGASMIIKWGLDTLIDTRVVYTANTEGQMRSKTAPELTKWHRMSATRHWFEARGLSLVSKSRQHETTWRADGTPWSEHNTEAFAGLHNQGKRIILLFDEASNIADKVWEVAEGALTDEETEIIWLVFGNPTQNTGRFRECFRRFRQRWVVRQIDSREVEGTNRTYLQDMVNTYGEDSDIVKVRVRGMFPSASLKQFIPSALVDEARKRETRQALPSDPMVLGVDIGGLQGDPCTIYFRKGRNARVRDPIIRNDLDTMQLASLVAEQARAVRADIVNVDMTGIGLGVHDRLLQLNVPGVIGVHFGANPLGAVELGEGVKVANRRAELYALCRSWLPEGCIPDDPELAEELEAIEFGYNAHDEILLEKKAHIRERLGRSTDRADGLVLTFATPAALSPVGTPWTGSNDDYGDGDVPDWNPFDAVRR